MLAWFTRQMQSLPWMAQCRKKMEAVKRLNGKKVLLTYAGSHVFQLFSRIHLSNKWSDGGRQVQAGVSAFLHLIWCIFCSHLIELPNLFFKQQCSTKSHDIKQLNMSLKVCILCSSSFLCSRQGAQRPGDSWFWSSRRLASGGHPSCPSGNTEQIRLYNSISFSRMVI